jgi:hypothetical protein
MRQRTLLAVLFALFLLACSDNESPPDSMTAPPDLVGRSDLPAEATLEVNALPADSIGPTDLPESMDATTTDSTPPQDITTADFLFDQFQPMDVAINDAVTADAVDDQVEPYEVLPEPDLEAMDSLEVVVEPVLPQPPQACGMTPYTWLPKTAVGDVVAYEEQILYNLPPVFIEELIGEAGYSLDLPLKYTPRVFKLRYTTQNKGELVEATAMVGFPDLAAPDAPAATQVPAALFLHGTTGFANKCAPSNGLEGAAAAVLPAAAGFIAIAPDYIGLCGFGEPCPETHPYLVGEPTAIASLDAARAALKLRELLLQDGNLPEWDGRLAAWGASQGGHAALFVDRFAPYYAPEFDVPCVVAVVPPANLAGQAATALTTLSSAASLGISFLVGAHLWYAPDQTLAGLLNPDGPLDYSDYAPTVYPTTCNAKALYPGAKTLADIFVQPALDALAQGNLADLVPWGCIALENSLTTTSLPYHSKARLLFLIGEGDNLVSDDVERETFLQLCDQGYVAEFIECAGLGHTQTALESVTLQLEWLFECLEDPLGVPSSACKLHDPQSCKLQ